MKKSVSIILVLALLFGTAPTASGAEANVTAAPASSVITVDGAVTGFDAYLINGSNYFKLYPHGFIQSFKHPMGITFTPLCVVYAIGALPHITIKNEGSL